MIPARPPFLIFIAALDLFGLAAFIALFVWIELNTPTDEISVPLIVVCTAFVLFRLATAIGLLRLLERARIVEVVYTWIRLIVFGVGALILLATYWKFGVAALCLAFTAIIVVAYLRSPEVRLLLSRRIDELPEEERAGVQARLRRISTAQWAAMILVTVALAGMAIVAPANLSDAFQRGRQKRTMSDMRRIATAWEARATDLNRYNAAGALVLPEAPVSPAELSRNLAPRYIGSIPALDHWGHPYTFHLDVPFGGDTAAESFAIRSFGRDGKASPLVEGSTSDYDCDIVLVNSIFVVYPEGRSD